MAEETNRRNRKSAQSMGVAQKPLVGGVFNRPLSPAVRERLNVAVPGAVDAFAPYIDPVATAASSVQQNQLDMAIAADAQEAQAVRDLAGLSSVSPAQRQSGLNRIIANNPLAAGSPYIKAYGDATSNLAESTVARDPYIRSMSDPEARRFYQSQLQAGLSPDDAMTATLTDSENRQIVSNLKRRGIDTANLYKNGALDREASQKALDEAEKINPSKGRIERLSVSVNKALDDKFIPAAQEAIQEQLNEYGPYQSRIEGYTSSSESERQQAIDRLTKEEKKELEQNPPFDSQGNLTPYWSNKIATDRAAKVNSRVAPAVRDLIRRGMAPGEVASELGLPLEEVQRMQNPPTTQSATTSNPANNQNTPEAPPAPRAPQGPAVRTLQEVEESTQEESDTQARGRVQEVDAAQWQSAKNDVLTRVDQYAREKGVSPVSVLATLARGRNNKEITDLAKELGLAESINNGRGTRWLNSPIQSPRMGSDEVPWSEVIKSVVSASGESNDLLSRYGVTGADLHNEDARPNYPRMNTPDEALKLPPGTLFLDSNGDLRQRP